MMASRHLRELLNEVQEPFVLKNYINEKHSQIKRQVTLPKTHLQLKRRRPISESSNFPLSFCKNACFLSFPDSPDLRSSPLFDFCAPVKSPCRSSNALFVHVPAKTAALLLEAALRIQNPSDAQKPKATKNLVFGFFGSIVKKISNRKRNQKKMEIKGGLSRVPVKDIVNCDACNGGAEEKLEKSETMVDLEERRAFGSGFSCSCNSRLSSIWSESNEEKSLDFETSSSGSEDSEEMNFIGDQREGGDFSSCDKGFCSSPFRFVLQTSWSPSRGTPEFASPATSPGRLRRQALQKDEGDLDCSRKGFEEEEKDQNSPVSVLDPPFEDDDNQGHQDGGEGEGKHDEFELEHSFAIVQRARHKLLNKLCQFERLAELDPVELEKKMVEDVEDEDISEYVYHSSDLSGNKKGDEASIREVLTQSDLYSCRRIPQDMKRLVLDLMAEEESADTDPNSTNTVKRVCERLEAWKEVEMNTIDMMVELDFRKQAEEWKKNVEQVQEVAVAIELAILGFLMEELSNELAHSS